MTKGDNASIKIINQHGPMGFVMFVAFIGAFTHFSQHATNFGDILLAIIKAIVWPGFVVYHILQILGA